MVQVLWRNECIYRTEDGGCRKLYISCPLFVEDATDLGCGGVCIEYDIEESEEDDENATS